MRISFFFLSVVNLFPFCLVIKFSIPISSEEAPYKVKVKMGESSVVEREFLIDLQMRMTFITYNIKKKTDSSKELVPLDYCSVGKFKEIPCTVEEDQIKFPGSNLQLKNFVYYLLMANPFGYEVFSFSLQQESVDTSLVHKLYSEKKISSPSFKLSKGELSLGEDPKKSIPIGSCKSSKEWGCNLREVKFNKNTFENTPKDPSIINADSYGIKCPQKFINFLTLFVFYEPMKLGICQFEGKFTCSRAFVEQFPGMSFVFNETSIELSQELFVKDSMGSYVFQIEQNFDNFNQWKFGQVLLEKYSFLFNFHKSEIFIYKNEKNTSTKKIKFLLCVAIAELMIGIAVIQIKKMT